MKLKKSYRVSAENFEIIQLKAKLCNMSVSEYIENIAVNGEIKYINKKAYSNLLTEISDIKDLFYKLNKVVYDDKIADEIIEIKNKIDKVTKYITKVF